MLNQSLFVKIIGLLFFSILLAACGGGGTNNTASSPAKFSHVKMHYGLLKNQSLVWGENENIHNISLTTFSAKGSTTLDVANSASLLQNQLIVYLSTNGNYYVAKVQSLPNAQQIILSSPLEGAVSAGNNAWNFYANSSHANVYGFRAIADFAVRSLGFGAHTGGKHVLLGDSWFDEDSNESTSSRLKQKLSGATLINKGVGGNTTQDLINRFDTDVTPHAPEYIWIMSGTNDYWQGVSTAQFKANLKTLINKSKAIGAKVIIFDSSVGVGTGNTGVPNHHQSDEYVRVLKELY